MKTAINLTTSENSDVAHLNKIKNMTYMSWHKTIPSWTFAHSDKHITTSTKWNSFFWESLSNKLDLIYSANWNRYEPSRTELYKAINQEKEYEHDVTLDLVTTAPSRFSDNIDKYNSEIDAYFICADKYLHNFDHNTYVNRKLFSSLYTEFKVILKQLSYVPIGLSDIEFINLEKSIKRTISKATKHIISTYSIAKSTAIGYINNIVYFFRDRHIMGSDDDDEHKTFEAIKLVSLDNFKLCLSEGKTHEIQSKKQGNRWGSF